MNCFGVMGAGLAKEFAFRYPGMFKDYAKACKDTKLYVGTIHKYVNGSSCIVNFPTKGHWSRPSSYQNIEIGMRVMVKYLLKQPLRTVAIPRLGCGLGGLQWGTVKQIVLREIEPLPDDFTVYLFGEG